MATLTKPSYINPYRSDNGKCATLTRARVGVIVQRGDLMNEGVRREAAINFDDDSSQRMLAEIPPKATENPQN